MDGSVGSGDRVIIGEEDVGTGLTASPGFSEEALACVARTIALVQ